MSEVVGVVHARAARGRGPEVLAALETCAVSTHREEGCIRYAVHRDNADPDHLVLLERWRSQADLDAHLATPHVAALLDAVAAPGLLVSPPELAFTTALVLGDPVKGGL